MTVGPRTLLMLFVVSCYLILNVGFMLLRIPPVGPGVPVGQLLLAMFILTFALDLRHGSAFVRSAPAAPLLAWWVVGLGHLIPDTFRFGFWAFRDAAHWMETGFLWVGFVLASRPGFFALFQTWMFRTFQVGMLYMILFPAREALAKLSPQIHSVSGYSTPFVFSYINASSVALTGVMQTMIASRRRLSQVTLMLAAAVCVLVTLFFFQARIAYVQTLLIFAMVAYLRPQRVPAIVGMALVGVLLAALLLSLPIEMQGRYGEKVSLEFLINHIKAIWGGGDVTVRSAAEGVDLRTSWWVSTIDKVNSSLPTAVFGLGFGIPLTNFHGPDGDLVREVHNSFISVYGRLGAAGLLLFATIQARIYLTGARLILLLRKLGDVRKLVTVSTMVCLMSLDLIFSLGEPGFELSYVSIPYYFLAGVLFALNRQVRLGLNQSDRGR